MIARHDGFQNEFLLAVYRQPDPVKGGPRPIYYHSWKEVSPFQQIPNLRFVFRYPEQMLAAWHQTVSITSLPSTYILRLLWPFDIYHAESQYRVYFTGASEAKYIKLYNYRNSMTTSKVATPSPNFPDISVSRSRLVIFKSVQIARL